MIPREPRVWNSLATLASDRQLLRWSILLGFPEILGGTNGLLCITGPSASYGRHFPPVAISAGGTLTELLDLQAFPHSTATPSVNTIVVGPGETWYFQCWYRDGNGSPSTNNFSNAICVQFAP